MKSRLVYSPEYDFGILGLEKLHPFDAKKFSKAWVLLQERYGDALYERTRLVSRPITDQELAIIHSGEYLASLVSSSAVARIVEVSPLKYLPSWVLKRGLITPARYATGGTVTAARQALEGSVVFNIGGGFHHAFADHGEGFCFFADAALALEIVKKEGSISSNDTVLMIDLDAHRGNGFFSFYKDDVSVGMFDLYNMQVYPGLKNDPGEKFPFVIPMRSGLGSEAYLTLLKSELPNFFEAYPQPKLAFYNAGTDILETDKLGGLRVSFDAVVERDRYVVDQLRSRGIPTVVMTSGGYSKDSYKLVAKLAAYLLDSDA